MENIELSSNGKKLSDFLDIKMHDGQLSNNDLVHFIEQVGRYLNLETIPDCAKRLNITYNGVKKTKQIVEIFNVKFVIDNE
jgi:uncharacterized protein involved in outer membrane biogenesis